MDTMHPRLRALHEAIQANGMDPSVLGQFPQGWLDRIMGQADGHLSAQPMAAGKRKTNQIDIQPLQINTTPTKAQQRAAKKAGRPSSSAFEPNGGLSAVTPDAGINMSPMQLMNPFAARSRRLRMRGM